MICLDAFQPKKTFNGDILNFRTFVDLFTFVDLAEIWHEVLLYGQIPKWI